MARKRAAESRGDRNTRREALAAVADKFKSFRPARQVLKRVRAVPTIFPQVDHATRVGGWPIERFTLVHGPSNEGKSLFVLGLVKSFLQLDGFAVYVDAERTTPLDWVETLVGADLVDHPGFFVERPDTYEDTILRVRNFLNTLAQQREKGKVAADTPAIVIVDSMRKLVPADLMKEILDAESDETKTGRDRRAQLQAKMNAAWMDELVPLLESAQAGFVAIAREMQDPDANVWAKKFGNDYKVGGGGAMYYDASLVARIERASWVTHGEGAARKVYGERHRVTIKKTKIGGKDDKQTVAYFHSSNGTFVPEGFDGARDVLELGLRLKVITQSGSTYSLPGTVLGRSEHAVVKNLAGDPDLLRLLSNIVRSRFPFVPPPEHDADGVLE